MHELSPNGRVVTSWTPPLRTPETARYYCSCTIGQTRGQLLQINLPACRMPGSGSGRPQIGVVEMQAGA